MNDIDIFFPLEQNQHTKLKNVLSAGTDAVLENNAGVKLTFRVRFCRAADLDDILALQKRVYETIANKETFVLTNGEELMESLKLDTCIGAYLGMHLAAFTLMVSNPYSSRNLGLYLDYGQEQCAKCVTYDTTFVDPGYKGYGLQRLFIGMKDTLASDMGAEEALATVSPGNEISLKNLLSGGFTVAERKKMYGNYDRLILRKPLTAGKG